MLLFGHPYIESESFYHIATLDALAHTPPSSTVLVNFCEANLDIIDYLKRNGIPFALDVASPKEVLFAHALGAAYICVLPQLAKTAQQFADNYLFDAKILVHVSDDEMMEKMAIEGVDGVIYPHAIVKATS